MINGDDIPADVRQFILAKIDSVPQLEALLLIWERRPRAWSEQELARALYIEPVMAKRVVAELLRRGWAKIDSDRIAFDDAWDPDGSFIAKLAHTYRTRLVRVATLIHTNASSAVRDFARAFDLKKD